MKKIAQDIEEQKFKQIYLLYGEESYLRKQYRDKLVNALIDPDDTMNYHYFEGKDISAEKLIDLSETMPFFSQRRVIVVENSDFFKSSQEKLADYLKELPATTVFIFVEKQADKRGRVFKVCKDKGYVAEFGIQNEAILKRWIVGVINKEGKQITQRALDLFLERCGNDMENIASELEKLLCYTLTRTDITEPDVDTICTRQINNRIFDMIEDVAQKKQKAALDLYYDLLALKEPPMRILFLITRQFNMLYQTKLLRKNGYDAKAIGTKLGLAPFIANKYLTQSAHFKTSDLREAIEECVRSEEGVKTGKMTDVLAVELLIIRFSS